MWFERFVIIVTSLHRDFLPSAWGYFRPTIWDVSCLLGSFGLFFTMFCLFVRFLPMVATAEVKTVLPQADPHWQAGAEREIRATAPLAKDASPPAGGPAVRGASLAMGSSSLLNRLPKGPYYGILAEFATPADLYHACERVRDAGFTRWDAHTPFPVHGLEQGDGAPALPASLDRPRHGTDGGRARVRPAVVGPRRRLPSRDQRQAVFPGRPSFRSPSRWESSSPRSAPSSACSA